MGFKLFGTFIPYYGFFILIGIVCAFTSGYFLCKKLTLNIDDFIIICAYLVSFGFVGAKILYILISINDIDFHSVFSSVENFNNFFNSGFVFYGGLIGGFLALFLVKKIHKIQIQHYIKIIAPCLALAHGFGRIGCSFAGCCYGKVTDGNIFFEYSESLVAPNGVHLFPVQGIESFSLFCLFFLLVLLLLKNKNTKTHIIYIIFYSVDRFILEFLRGDIQRGIYGLFSTSQIISLILFFTMISYLFVKRCKKIISKNLKT